MGKVKLLTRKEFLALLEKLPTRKWKGVVLHHTFKPDYSSWKKLHDHEFWWVSIDAYHRGKGWKKIGYHWLIFPDGLIAVGRSMTEVGAHTKGKNTSTVGVCLLGNFDVDEMNANQYISAWFVLTALLVKLSLPPDALFFHRNFADKTCPGMKLDLEDWRRKVKKHYEEMRAWMKRD